LKKAVLQQDCKGRVVLYKPNAFLPMAHAMHGRTDVLCALGLGSKGPVGHTDRGCFSAFVW
jgi:hypothetical protein